MGLFSMKLFHKSGSKADKSAESVLENYNVIAEQLDRRMPRNHR